MHVACLWSHWSVPGGQDLFSFSAITDETPAEVSAAGHVYCIIPIRPENIAAMLGLNPSNLAASLANENNSERP